MWGRLVGSCQGRLVGSCGIGGLFVWGSFAGSCGAGGWFVSGHLVMGSRILVMSSIKLVK